MHVMSAAGGAPVFLAKSLPAERLADLLAPRLAGTGARDLLLYVHIPFCTSKCTFCNWVSGISVQQLRSGPSVRAEYAAAVATQIRAVAPMLNALDYTPRHIYWGGGTPSILSEDDLERITGAFAEAFDLTAVGEHTIEASPETLTPGKLDTLKRLGMNRVSLGIQSFDDHELRRAGRAHSAALAERAVRDIRAAGFDNFNVDLIVGFPEQTMEALARTLERTIALAAPHVTAYVYRPEAGTVMARQIHEGHRPARALADNLRAYALARQMLESAGYVEYTVGYFTSAPAYRFEGEEYYFGLQGDYVGFGCGGESVLGHHSLVNPPSRLTEFVARPDEFYLAERFAPDRLEGVLRALRLTILTEGGIEFRRFERFFGFPFASIRHHPHVKGLLRYLAFCGAEFVESAERLFITEATRSVSYVVALQRAFAASKKHAAPRAAARAS